MKKILQKIFFRSFNLKHAIFYSILFHIVLLMIVSYLFRLSLTLPINKIQSVLDFVFEPGIDEINIITQHDVQEFEQRKNQLEKEQLLASSAKSDKSQKKNANIKTETDESTNFPEEKYSYPQKTWSQNAELDKDGLFTITNSDFISRLGFSNITPKIRFKPRIYSASYPISTKRQKNIQKKIFKFLDQIYDVNFKDTTFTWEESTQILVAKFSRLPPIATTDQEELEIDVTTEDRGNAVTTKIRMKRIAFSNYAHFVDFWDPMVAVHDDEIDGRFHSNTNFSISRADGIKPKFTGKVTTAGYEVNSAGTFPIFNFDAIFTAGLETGVQEILFPKNFSPISNDSSKRGLSIHEITTETWLTFLEDGTYNWRNKSDQQFINTNVPQDRPHFIIGDKKSIIHLQGVLRGKVLVYSRGKIVIDDNLLYGQNPEIFEYSNDYLGIVSQQNVEIAPPSVTGDGDLKIYGAIYAKNRFRIPNRNKNGNATLFIYGSLSAGSISATEPRYATRVIFDKRFENQRPPNFPLTNRYEITNWKRNWKIDNNHK